MFNKNFYPTPKKVIRKMIKDWKPTDRILEPSAGKGDILDYIYENKGSYFHRNKNEFFAIEIEPELQAILRDKEYKVIDNDFLSYSPDCTFDTIIMNPPFDEGAKHFLKAWEIASDTEIICLLNEETIKNPYTKERKLIQKILEDNNGNVEYLGECFSTAERKTKVNIALVKVTRVAKEEYTFQFDKKFDQEKQFNPEDISDNQIANNDVFGNLELRYNKLRELCAEIISLKKKMQYYSFTTHILDFMDDNLDDGGKRSYNNFCDQLRKAAWSSLFTQTKVENVVTSKVRNKIDKIQESQGHMSFTAKNMEALFSDLMQNYGSIMQDCVVEAFDLMTKYHKENRCHVEGWKTNERFFVNRKFILPVGLNNYGSGYHISYYFEKEIADIDKGLCFIVGKKHEEINSIYRMFNKHEIQETGTWYDSEFFEFKIFQKGTMHLKFKSESLWNKFNVTACKGKNWLGFDEKQK